MSDVRPAADHRLTWVDAGRGVAILLVVLYHAARWLSRAGFDTADWQALNTVLSSLRMPLFFTLSGLFARKWLWVSWPSLLRSKVLLFGWVFLVWETIGSAAFVVGTTLDGRRVSLWDTALSLLVSPVVPRLELWFIWALALFFVTAKALRTVPPWVQLSVSGVASAVALTVWITQTTGVTGFLKYFVFFLGGVYLRDSILRFGRTRNRWVLVGAFAVWAVTSIVLAWTGLRVLPGVYFLNCVVGVTGGIALSRALTRLSLLHWLGRQTLPIYLAHTPIIIVLSFILSTMPVIENVVPAGLATPLVAALALILALLLHRTCQRSWLRYLYAPPPLLPPAPWARVRTERRFPPAG